MFMSRAIRARCIATNQKTIFYIAYFFVCWREESVKSTRGRGGCEDKLTSGFSSFVKCPDAIAPM